MAEESPSAGYRTLYRIVGTDSPVLWDFTSYQAKGRPPPRRESETLDLWAGLVYPGFGGARILD